MKGLSTVKKVIIFILLFSIFGVYFGYANEKKPIQEPNKNVVLIGWDGVQRAHLMELLNIGQLPSLKKLIGEGSLVYTQVTTGTTQTKPGWAEILTGYSAERLEIYDNRLYKPIPEGYTVFERLKDHFGSVNIITVFIGGKINNIGDRGLHQICENCISRDPVSRSKTNWWDKELITTSQTKDGKPPAWVSREGEPYLNSKKTIDFYRVGLGPARNVAKQGIHFLETYYDKPFFAFFHFEEPDEQGHIYGENSLQYTEGLKTADYWLGAIIRKLKSLGIYDKTVIFISSDHGMDEASFEHDKAPYMFFAVNGKRKLRDGDRKDITPTILEEYGIDLSKIYPPLDGKSLKNK